ncbi:tRNA N(3)-methylcytidine methyltransferase METTL6 isoform X1 [Hippopotamus amphibius kiboko]|uniref:tRNA N(3)-methylcytidine methyltransferase METTL6 isoform X1 n=1 Tax=Hippopotamus amphibius kiboko TaxID=575201 RepID=UPI002599BAE0|nr:tRNA N(3)-methylcytidine methyltransferase METTL6 isoform X1 [Hippopotamus amphibius kiboko]XP_057593815.1 tRNA N(3)-methylcytidine methyltransferase METTL6 isoform X1 [Hippopotamus amphibius kiboko]XP_057593816.1 tRNA N(3)-methylcytidine methyltransferase METTL6 isoform X1 [Hippopotamus amphibius kiboko]XP_057593817.1 tRNA N(3)-methylcytidine methyltransferase METTL6 isoform X1 [Hippopotamus amphibius kiboko]
MAALQRKGLQARILSSEEEEKLKRDQALVSHFKQQKLEKEAQKNWDLFYKRNSTNFFKDRHWTTREFEELRSCREFEDQKLTVLEAGCGVGNCLFPLLEEDPNIFAYACDFSPRAVEYVKQNPLYDTERCRVFQCDLTKDDLLEHVPPESVDVVTLIFVLSAVHPDKMHLILQNIYKVLQSGPFIAVTNVLKPGKSVLFRDYGLYDHAMLRFKAGSKLAENFYVRQDGTRSYFFTDEFLARLFLDTGYEEEVNEYVFRETVNKKEGLCVPRVFLQSKFRKSLKNPTPVTPGLGHES